MFISFIVITGRLILLLNHPVMLRLPRFVIFFSVKNNSQNYCIQWQIQDWGSSHFLLLLLMTSSLRPAIVKDYESDTFLSVYLYPQRFISIFIHLTQTWPDLSSTISDYEIIFLYVVFTRFLFFFSFLFQFFFVLNPSSFRSEDCAFPFSFINFV